MRLTRFPALIAVPLLALMLAACSAGSPSPSTDDGGGGGGGESTPAATPDNGGGGGGDVEQVAEDLVPPNSSQLSQTNSEGVIWTVYESTDSPESLKNFYENAIPQTGMQVFSTSTVEDTYSWVFAQDDGSSFGGSVTVGPASDGGSGSSVIVIVSDGG